MRRTDLWGVRDIGLLLDQLAMAIEGIHDVLEPFRAQVCQTPRRHRDVTKKHRCATEQTVADPGTFPASHRIWRAVALFQDKCPPPDEC
jgi:hypothetical protein